ncbi:hypothetical protein ACF0H5_004683 [Mactra antiquata]
MVQGCDETDTDTQEMLMMLAKKLKPDKNNRHFNEDIGLSRTTINSSEKVVQIQASKESNSKGQTRTKSQASPESTGDQPDKRATMAESSPVPSVTTPTGDVSSPASSGYVTEVNPNVGYYLPPHTQFMTPTHIEQSP